MTVIRFITGAVALSAWSDIPAAMALKGARGTATLPSMSCTPQIRGHAGHSEPCVVYQTRSHPDERLQVAQQRRLRPLVRPPAVLVARQAPQPGAIDGDRRLSSISRRLSNSRNLLRLACLPPSVRPRLSIVGPLPESSGGPLGSNRAAGAVQKLGTGLRGHSSAVSSAAALRAALSRRRSLTARSGDAAWEA